VESLRKFKLDPSKGVKQNDELIPPPTFSDKTIPVNWGYHQNSTIKVTTDQTTGETILTNQSLAPKIKTYYIPYDTPTVPSSPPPLPPPDPILQSLLTELQQALAERPIWTRRAILNRIPRSNPGIYLLKPAIQYIGYQFRGGPWRDAIVRYGVDPRSSPEYRIYQTLFFKIVDYEPAAAAAGKPWHDKRSEYTRKAHPETLDPNSHVFDGTSVSLDGKIWQVCDIADPLLVRLLSTPTLRDKCDLHSDGWFCNGTWAKVRAIMRTKISAIRIGREMHEADFRQTLLLPDDVKDKSRVTAYMPNLGVGLGVDVDDDADAEVEDLVEGTGVLGAAATGGQAWRRRKMKGIKRRRRRGVGEMAGGTRMMGFGKAGSGFDGRNLGTGTGAGKGKGKGVVRGDILGLGNEALNVGESVTGSGHGESVALGRDADVGAHFAAKGSDSLHGAAESNVGDGSFHGESGEREEDEDEQGGEDDDDDGDGEDEDDLEQEDDLGDEDDGEEDDDEELDGEGW
jgi:general transcription factor 3C polypeptide 5 (transcription factor C subunit 1)